MNFLSKCGIAGLMFASSGVFAAEPAMGWYAGIFAGPSFAPSRKFDIYSPFFTTTPLLGKLSYGVLANGGGQLGYRCNKFRFEGELVYNANNFDELTVNGFTITNNQERPGLSIRGKTSFTAGLFNAYYEFYDEDYSETQFVPYIGLGVGYAHIRNTLDFYYYSPYYYINRAVLINRNRNSESTNSAIGQAIIGINYFFNDSISLGTDFRYMSTGSIGTLDSRITSRNTSRVQVGTWNFLLNFSFDQP
ncbi:MAG: outer membrane beta-barrel protein [Legionella sp.]|nr:outer membrane beta-barrel protein [Legionella sp.]